MEETQKTPLQSEANTKTALLCNFDNEESYSNQLEYSLESELTDRNHPNAQTMIDTAARFSSEQRNSRASETLP